MMLWLAQIVLPALLEFIRKPSPIVAIVICFSLWAWLDHCDKRYLADTFHTDMVTMTTAINHNTSTLGYLNNRLAEKLR